MSFRQDVPVLRTRKQGRCTWCQEMILVGAPAVRVRGGEGGEIWAGRLHPECWRAELAYWTQPERPDEWPDEPCPRGVTVDWLLEKCLVYWKVDPVSAAEAKNPYAFQEAMKLPTPPHDRYGQEA